jgi:hypothetical protein
MKKTRQILAIIISLIIITSFVGSAQAQVCTGDYVIDDIDTSGDIAVLSGCTEITGSLTITGDLPHLVVPKFVRERLLV